jgi:Na+/H+ antiporter NhaC
MMYLAFPALILAMMGYMFFHVGFSMRRDRIRSQRAERRIRWVPKRTSIRHP